MTMPSFDIKSDEARRVVVMCKHVADDQALCRMTRCTPGAADRLDYVRYVADCGASSYYQRVVQHDLTEDYDVEYGSYVRLSDFASKDELIDYVVSGLSRQGQFVLWGARGRGFALRLRAKKTHA
jgi:hypothetical protein